MTRAPMVLPKPGRAWGSSGEIADTTLGWRLVNPRMREASTGARRRSPRRDGRGSRRARRDHAGRVRRLRPALAAARGGGGSGSPGGRGHHRGRRRRRHRRAGRGAGHDGGGARRAQARLPIAPGSSPRVARSPLLRRGRSDRRGERTGRRAARGSSPERGWSPLLPRACPPHIMGLGPVRSTEKVLERHRLAGPATRRGRDRRGVRAAGDHLRPAARPRPGRPSTPKAGPLRSDTRWARPGSASPSRCSGASSARTGAVASRRSASASDRGSPCSSSGPQGNCPRLRGETAPAG